MDIKTLKVGQRVTMHSGNIYGGAGTVVKVTSYGVAVQAFRYLHDGTEVQTEGENYLMHFNSDGVSDSYTVEAGPWELMPTKQETR
ncbi:MAG: hypothetical protein WB558_13560 [Terriglobales bacterium]